MGLHTANLIDRSISLADVVGSGDTLLSFIKDAAVLAGWTRQRILAQMTFTAVGIASGDKIILDNLTFEWYSVTPPVMNIPVPIGSNQTTALANLGTAVETNLEWSYQLGGTAGNPTITFTLLDDNSNPEDTRNDIEGATAPLGGAVGLFDNNADNIAGAGRSWGGGFKLTSQTVFNSGPLIFKITTAIASSIKSPLLIATEDGEGIFTGLQTPSGWRLLISQYQIILFVPGTLTSGHFMLLSHMYPAFGFYANYIVGPVNSVSPGGGARADLQSIGIRYYVDVGTPYQGQNTGDPNTNPCFLMPGWGTGVTQLQKLGNRIAAIDIRKDDGNAYPFEPFVAACPDDTLTQIYGLGQLWDSCIYSAYAVADSTVDFNGDPGIVLFSQVGTSDNTRGAFVARTIL